MLNELRQIGILGTGLMGASLGLAIKLQGFKGVIVGYSRQMSTLNEALGIGALDRAVQDPRQAMTGSQLVIVATPLGVFESLFQHIAVHGDRELIVTDVGSTKTVVHELAGRLLPNPIRFVGSHPMAGSEKQGPAAAKADLFEHKPCILTANEHTDPHALGVVESMWRALKMNLIRMSPREHDLKAAAISHVPHLMSVLLVRLADRFAGWDIASTGFRDATRLACSNPPMRRDIVQTNRSCVLDALKYVSGDQSRLIDQVDRGEWDALLADLESSQKNRVQWMSKSGKEDLSHGDE